jgi:hypothetical protein
VLHITVWILRHIPDNAHIGHPVLLCCKKLQQNDMQGNRAKNRG